MVDASKLSKRKFRIVCGLMREYLAYLVSLFDEDLLSRALFL